MTACSVEWLTSCNLAQGGGGGGGGKGNKGPHNGRGNAHVAMACADKKGEILTGCGKCQGVGGI